MAQGADDIRRLRAGGMSEAEIQVWEDSTRRRLTEGGMSQNEVDTYFGRGPIQFTNEDAGVRSRLSEARAVEEGQEPRNVGFVEALDLGFQTSITGLSTRQRAPDQELSASEEIWDQLAFAIGQTVGDLPVSVPSFFPGMFAGAKGGGAVGAAGGGVVAGPPGAGAGAVAGALIGGLVGGGASSGAVTAATRESLLDFYSKNPNATAREFATGIASSVLREETFNAAAFEGTVGAVTGLGGGVTRGVAAKALKSNVARELAVGSAEMVSAVGAVSAIEGELPDANDFALAAGAFLSFKTAELGARATTPALRKVEQRLKEHYKQTGERPEDVARRAESDPNVQQQFVADDIPSTDSVAKQGDYDARDTDFTTDGDKAQPTSEDIFIDPKDVGQKRAEAAREADTTHTAIVEAGRPEPKDITTAPRDVDGVGDGSPPPPPPKAPKDIGSPDGDAALFRAQINPTKTRFSYTVDDFRFDFVNDLQHVVSEARGAFKDATGKRLSTEANPGELARLASGAQAKAEVELKVGIFDENGKKVSRSLSEVLDEIPELDRENFSHYVVARRVLEKNNQGIETGFDVDAAQRIVNRGDQKPSFKKTQAAMQEWMDSGLKRLVESGVLAKDQAEKIIQQNMDFIPFARLMDDEGVNIKGVTTRGLPVRDPIGRFKGSKRGILNPFEVLVKNRYALTQMAENNLARQRVVEFNSTLPEEFQFIERVGKKPTKGAKDKPLSASKEIAEFIADELSGSRQLKEFVESHGMTPDDLTGVAVYWSAQRRLRNGEFIVFEEGRPVIYRAKNPKLAASLQSLDGMSMNILTKILRTPSAIMRTGIVLAPDFILRNMIRDNLSSVLINSFKVVPVYDAIVGMKSLLRKDADYVKWVESGGANSALLDIDQRILGRGFGDDEVLRSFGIKSAWNTALTPYRMLAYGASLAENAMRIGQFKRSQKTGTDQLVSGLRSRDVSLDFGRMGARIRAWNSITSFLGASINGTDRLIQAFRERPAETTLQAAAMITLPSLLLWWANKDEQWYKDTPDWQKALFWMIRVDGGPPDDPNPTIVRIPMPLQFGTLFGFVPIRTLEGYIEERPGAAKDVTNAIMDAFKLDVAPVAVSPLVEIGTNYNFFTGKPLVSQRLERTALPQYRYTPYTTETAKAISQFLSPAAGSLVNERFTTPTAIDHLVRSWTGTLPQQALTILEDGARAAGILDAPARPDRKITELPFVRGFFVRMPDSSGVLEKFYSNVDRIDQVVGSIDALTEQERFTEADQLEDRYADVLMKTSGVRRAVGNLHKAIRAIQFDPEMTGAEKRQLVDGFMFDVMDITRTFNEEFEEAQKEANR